MNRLEFSTRLPVLVLLAAPLAAQCPTTRASTDATGLQGDLGSGLSTTALNRTYLSSDGRFVAFWSSATNLVPGDTNAKSDVFVRDLVAGTIERVSVDSAGLEANGDSTDPSISADGRIVAFQSAATNLAPGDGNGRIDIFVRDRTAGTTTRVSLDSSGVEGDHDSTRADVSSNGLYVAFQSRATNWVPNDTNNKFDAFVKNRATGVLDCVSLDPAGAVGDNTSGSPAVSGDGRWVAFHSLASNLVPNDTNGQFDVYLRDRQTGTLERLSVGPAGEEADYFSQAPSITPDGRYVAFSSTATNLVVGDTNNLFDVFVRDTALDVTRRISVDDQNYQGTSTSQGNSISADGRFVCFQSSAPNLVLGDTNGGPFNLDFDVFVHDSLLRTTTRLSVDDFGVQAASGSSYHACVSADASRVAFFSDATNLVAGDTNGARDLFVKGCGAPPGPTPHCAGDGTGTACPCGNTGSSGRGCNNSFSTGGGRLDGSGSTKVTNDTLWFQAYGLPNVASALLFQGDAEQNGGLGAVFGDGLRCAGGAILRLGSRFASGGSVSFGHGVPGDAPISVNGAIPAGTVSVRMYQIWYRNVADFCTPSGFNLTNGVRVVWTP
ncbi:MAG: calcium-binding protein [Planctomycetota bacterium]|nr:calcium-binding protein [Planctomycetota bacterium]